MDDVLHILMSVGIEIVGVAVGHDVTADGLGQRLMSVCVWATLGFLSSRCTNPSTYLRLWHERIARPAILMNSGLEDEVIRVSLSANIILQVLRDVCITKGMEARLEGSR